MHLEPTDLLNLSRSNHSLRNLLLSRDNTRFLWRYVLSKVRGLPASPSDMNELQYANLAFDETCHVSVLPLVDLGPSLSSMASTPLRCRILP